MTNLFTHIYNKCKQYSHRIFYTSTNNIMLHYIMLFSAISALDIEIEKGLKKGEPYITLISRNTLFKTIVFLYCFFSGSKLLLISPKFSTSEILNTILSKKNINVLLVDQDILIKLAELEKEEGINILRFFTFIASTSALLNIILEEKGDTTLSIVSKKGRLKNIFSDRPSVSILSAGTSSESSIIHLPYKILMDSMLSFSLFMGLKPSDKVSVIANFETYPGIFTILGLLTGINYILPEKNEDISSAEELISQIKDIDTKPNVLIISSYNFVKIWDSIMMKVYSAPFMLTFSKYWLTRWIVNLYTRSEIKNTFGENIKKVHILNEELGFHVLSMLKYSKIMFTSSYGFLEQGNFLAFKDPEVFKHKDFIYKPGGTILKKDEPFLVINKDENSRLGEIEVIDEMTEHLLKTIPSEDFGMILPNISNQGDRKFLYVYDRMLRHRVPPMNLPSLSLLERSLKDTWLIRDCFVQSYYDGSAIPKYRLIVEIRKDLLDLLKIPFEEIEINVRNLAESITKTSDNIQITHYAIVKFNGMRNIEGKLQYYNM